MAVERELGAEVTACIFDEAGLQAAFATGAGSLHLAAVHDASWMDVPAHDGAVLALARDATVRNFLSGGDDGRLVRVSFDGKTTELWRGRKWVEHVASFSGSKDGLIACAAGREVRLMDCDGAVGKVLEHPSTVTGLALDAKGKRLACAHYNGASLWFTASKSDTPRRLEWKGSHTGIALHPAGEAVVTSMQENALHGWRLADGQHMRMSGYPAKCESLSFSRNGKWLASAGADAIVLWPFFGGGPMGKPPRELAQVEGVICTRVACHPRQDLVLAGFADGSVLLADLGEGRVFTLWAAAGAPVTALAWSASGGLLAVGWESGRAAFGALPGAR